MSACGSAAFVLRSEANAPGSAKANSRASARRDARRRTKASSGEIAILGCLLFFILVLVGHLGQVERVGADHLEIAATLGARYDFAFIDLVLFNVEIGFAFRAQRHTTSGILLIFRFSLQQRQAPAMTSTRMGWMKRAFISIAVILLLSGSLAAQTKAPARRAPQRSAKAAPARPAAADTDVGEPERLPVDAQIAAALREISATHIRTTIEKLVSFGNRNTLGSADTEMAAKGQGGVAAR